MRILLVMPKVSMSKLNKYVTCALHQLPTITWKIKKSMLQAVDLQIEIMKSTCLKLDLYYN